MVGVFAKSPGRRGMRRSKHFLEDRVGSKRISPTAAPHGETPSENFLPAEELVEPQDIDQPVRCPAPEPSIMKDGIIWRAKILESLRRRNDILIASRERDSVVRGGSYPSRRHHNHSYENFLLLAHSAPEYEVRKLLE